MSDSFLSSEDSNESEIFKYNIHEFCQDLSKLYKTSKFREILTIIPVLELFDELPSSSRFLISKALFKLNRWGPALKEMALCLETCTDREEKQKLLDGILEVLKELKLYDRAEIICYEAIELLKADLDLFKINGKKKTESIKKIKFYENEVQHCIQNYDKIIDINDLPTTYVPLHEQASQYIKSEGKLYDYSLGRICIITERLVAKAVDSLESWKKNNRKFPDPDPAYKIFIALKYFGPMYVFDQLLQIEDTLKAFIEYELDMHPEIDYDVDPKSLVKQLQRWNSKNMGRTLYSLCGMIVKHNTVTAFMSYARLEYGHALAKFKWTLRFLSTLRKGLNYILDSSDYLSVSTEKVIALYICQCYSFGMPKVSNKSLELLLCSLVSTDDINITSEYSSGRLCVYFISCGYIYEKLAENHKTTINIQNKEELTIDKCFRLDREYIRESVRKYIIASTLKPHDDPTVFHIYNKILWCLLLLGGIHVKCFWFFNHFRNYVLVQNDYGPLVVSNQDKYKFIADEGIIDAYENGWEAIDKIYEVWNGLTEEEKSCAWNLDNNNCFLIPQAFQANKKLVFAQSFYDESSSYLGKSFVYESEYSIEQVLKGHIKIPNKIIQANIEFSKELVYMWCDSYMRYQRILPEFMIQIVQDFE